MNELQEYFARAAAELGLDFEIDHAVNLSDGKLLRSQVWFPNLGNHAGTLVFSVEDQPDRSAEEELMRRKYAMSVMSGKIPKTMRFDIESLKRTFSEWGWVGHPSLAPVWMISEPQDIYH